MCDTAILSDYIDLCTILKGETNPLKVVGKKKIYDRSTYNEEKFLDDMNKTNWSVINQQNNETEMLKSFTKIFTRVLQKHAHKKFVNQKRQIMLCSFTNLVEKEKQRITKRV